MHYLPSDSLPNDQIHPSLTEGSANDSCILGPARPKVGKIEIVGASVNPAAMRYRFRLRFMYSQYLWVNMLSVNMVRPGPGVVYNAMEILLQTRSPTQQQPSSSSLTSPEFAALVKTCFIPFTLFSSSYREK